VSILFFRIAASNFRNAISFFSRTHVFSTVGKLAQTVTFGCPAEKAKTESADPKSLVNGVAFVRVGDSKAFDSRAATRRRAVA
jgi:hypothetical protein